MINRLSDRNSMAICLYWQIKLIFLGWRDVIKVTQEFMMNKNMAAEFYKSSDRNSCWKSSWLWFLYLLWYRYCSNMLPILCNQLLFWSIFDLWSQLIYLIFKSRTDSFFYQYATGTSKKISWNNLWITSYQKYTPADKNKSVGKNKPPHPA